ncbi:hypothetical protein TNIN_251551 [Trichonephila inaurata madagascariensis]|uniref:Uncharacterized protein n=1 Tax=Trichonephila inaurata madagascariensis TaxID=2747483 RepID=A0A8X6X194_9ARAC|nr:hypothetical protein TNIN_251551 [Trichonephila inaurata madagascariensis]
MFIAANNRFDLDSLGHPPYRSNFASSDFNLFGPLKESLRVCRLTSDMYIRIRCKSGSKTSPKPSTRKACGILRLAGLSACKLIFV